MARKPSKNKKTGKNAKGTKAPKVIKPIEQVIVRGRPTVYTRELSDEICHRMASGETLNTICRDEDMPCRQTVVNWSIDDKDGFFGRYTRAREALYGHWEDESVDIADDGTNDFVKRLNKRGEEELAYQKEHVDRSKLRVETRKWMLAKLVPKFRDRIEQNHKADFKGIWQALGAGSHAPIQAKGE